jgi:hypothetical protein
MDYNSRRTSYQSKTHLLQTQARRALPRTLAGQGLGQMQVPPPVTNANVAITARASASRSSSSSSADSQTHPLPITVTTASQPRSLEHLAKLVGDHELACLLMPLVDSMGCDDAEIQRLAQEPKVMDCLRQLGPEALRRKSEGSKFLKHEPPLALIGVLADCKFEALAGKLISACPGTRVLEFAQRLLSGTDSLEGLPAKSINSCRRRALKRFRGLNAPPYLKNKYKALQVEPPGATFGTVFTDTLPAQTPIDWDELDREVNDSLPAYVGLMPAHEAAVYVARRKFNALMETLLGSPAPSDRARVTQLLQEICRVFAPVDPAALKQVEKFANARGLVLEPAPSTPDFWRDMTEKFAIVFAAAAAKAAVHPSSFPLLDHFPAARGYWTAFARGACLHALKGIPPPAKGDSGATLDARKSRKEAIVENLWATTITADLKDEHRRWRDSDAGGSELLGGNLSAPLAALQVDAETFIHLQLQSHLEKPLSQQELAGLYIGAILHGVHDSPFLEFPAKVALLASEQLMQLVADRANEKTAALMAHLLKTSDPNQPTRALVSAFMATLKEKRFEFAVSSMSQIAGVWPELGARLLRNFAVDREYELLAELASFTFDDFENSGKVPALFAQFGAIYPLTPEIAARMIEAKKQLAAKDEASKEEVEYRDKAVDAFIQGRLSVLETAPAAESSQAKLVRESESAALRKACVLLLQPKT